MNYWLRLWRGFTGLYILLSMWTPALWFMSHLKRHYNMDFFDESLVSGFDLFCYFGLLIAPLLAIAGYVYFERQHSRNK